MHTNRRPSYFVNRLLSLVAGALVATSGILATPALAQDVPPETSWRIILLPQADLWYHGLATAEFAGFGPDELYDEAYLARVRDAKQTAGVLPTALDDRASEFGGQFRRDQTFEVFHFVPLYFASTSVDPMLSALALVAATEGTPTAEDMLAQFGASAVAATIPSEQQRVVLGEWTETLRTEWDDFFADYWRGHAVETGPFIRSAQADWDQNFAPRLAGYLNAYRIDGGILVLSDPVGPEGRIFEGDPANPLDNIVVVGLDDDAGPRAPLFAAVREMCFPVVREVLAAQPTVPDRTEAATRSSHAAVRCGAYLLDHLAPDMAQEYRSGFASDAPGSPADVTAAFERKYPIDAAIRAAIQEKLGAIPGS